MKKSIKKNIVLFLLFGFLLILVTTSIVLAESAIEEKPKKVNIYFFYGKGCPHCAAEEPFLKEMEKKYPEIQVLSFEVWYNKENQKLMKQIAESYNKEVSGVPMTFIGDNVIVGYRNYETTGKEIEKEIKYCIENGCVDPGSKIKPNGINETKKNETINTLINLPIFGEIDSSKISLPIFTIIIGGLDGFNPCAFFVLLFLLSMLIYAESRKRMLLIGGIFVFFSGFVYFLFMAAWLNFFLLTGSLKIITIVAGIVAIVVALFNIKDFFFFKQGFSFSIPESAKPKLFKRMRNLLKASSLASMILGTIVLAISANTYELLCTAGFPMVFTRILTLSNLSNFQYYLYLILYNIIYVIPLAIIVLVFTLTLGAKKLSESQGQNLKLLSGVMMLVLGLILLLKPQLLNNVFVSVIIIALALLATILIVVSKKIVKKVKDKRAKKRKKDREQEKKESGSVNEENLEKNQLIDEEQEYKEHNKQ